MLFEKDGRREEEVWGGREKELFFHGLYKASSGHDFHEITVLTQRTHRKRGKGDGVDVS